MAQDEPNGNEMGDSASSGHLDGAAADQYAANNGPAAAAAAGLEYQQDEGEEIVQVVYQSNANGGLVGVGSTLLTTNGDEYNAIRYVDINNSAIAERNELELESPTTDGSGAQQTALPQPLRPASILPSVAEESSSGAAGPSTYLAYPDSLQSSGQFDGDTTTTTTTTAAAAAPTLPINYSGRPLTPSVEQVAPAYDALSYVDQPDQQRADRYYAPQNQADAFYPTISRHIRSNSARTFGYNQQHQAAYQQPPPQAAPTLSQPQLSDESSSLLIYANQQLQESLPSPAAAYEPATLYLDGKVSLSEQRLSDLVDQSQDQRKVDGERELDYENQENESEEVNEEIAHILSRQKQGAAESGSLKNNFRKKQLGISVSTNENELIAHRQKLLELRESNFNNNNNNNPGEEFEEEEGEPASLPLKFKRTHSVSFNVAGRSGRHSVDIRNLPSYLTVKRASIVDVAKGAMSSLIHSFGGAGGGSGASGNHHHQRRESSPDDEEPIFEEPIAPTLSLGQRVALVKNSGAEFGTVGWIGQLPDVDDDWIVGVIFDNMIGNCDGAYNGVRYFYARQNYAMFVPLSTLTKTDNYIGRPETGTMLSRMSVSLKPGQLISIQRSSIRLQHCFLNAPHQRVGHDVRAVSNRLHCQCHNCGPCAHLTKQGRINAIPAFGAHHAPNKKNSLAHAAVEILAHHHHHYHEEEHRTEDYQFGDNSAHACNYVRYSCCQQTGTSGHDLSTDCELVRPELLDNLIHAPRAPHRRHHRLRQAPRSTCQRALKQSEKQQYPQLSAFENKTASTDYAGAIGFKANNLSIMDAANSNTMSTWNESSERPNSESSYSSCSSSSSTSSLADAREARYNNNQIMTTTTTYDSSSYRANNSAFNTLETRMSLLEQQRFISQPESSALVQSQQQSYLTDDYDYQSDGGLGSSLRRCFNCIMGRKNRRRANRPAKRKLSVRNRMIEYRRKQSTFVPSTLAKPQEDFASHGIPLPSSKPLNHGDSNSDYSSYSQSSCSSRSSSPGHDLGGAAVSAIVLQEGQSTIQQQQQTLTIEHDAPTSNSNLKSSRNFQDQTFSAQFNYGDYSYGDGYSSYKKEGYSRDSALTDLGYFDSLTINSSNDTLKQIVDQTINDQVAHPDPISLGDNLQVVSPISTTESNRSDHVDISSLTASVNDQNENDDICQRIECLELQRDEDLPPED